MVDESSFDDGDELEQCGVFFYNHQFGDADVAGADDAVQIVADQVDDHEVLGALFG